MARCAFRTETPPAGGADESIRALGDAHCRDVSPRQAALQIGAGIRATLEPCRFAEPMRATARTL
jgi:hypothetical protein